MAIGWGFETMRTFRLVGLCVAVALATSSCGWLQLGGDAARTSFNGGETKQTSDKLPTLDYKYFLHSEGHGNAPIVNDGVLLHDGRQRGDCARR
jgi:hypothetical protein